MHFVQHVLCWTKPLAAQLVIIIVTPSTQHYCPQKQRNVLGDSGALNSKDHLHSKLALLGWEAAATVHSTTQLPSCNRSNCLPLNCLHSQSNKFNCLPFPSPFFPCLHAIAQINCADWFSSVYPLFFLSLTHSKLQLTLLHFPLPTSIEVGFFLFCLSVCLVHLSVLLCVSLFLLFACRINNSNAHFACRLDCILKHSLSHSIFMKLHCFKFSRLLCPLAASGLTLIRKLCSIKV